ncbi:MAG: hypothetical protein Q9225_004463, partial [Loekoesia sp. 1 TL-2023]
MNSQPLPTASADTSSPKPILPELNIPQTDISTFTPPISSATRTPKHGNNNNATPITTINISPITAILHSASGLPPLERQNPVPRVHGTRLEDYDTDDESVKSVQSWRAKPPRKGVVEHWTEPKGNPCTLADFLLADLNEAWWRNQKGEPRGDRAIWEGILGETVGRKVWVEDLGAVTMGRMGVKRAEPEGGDGSPLRFGVCVDGSSSSVSGNNEGRYRSSRFNEVYLDSETGCECLCPYGGERKWASTSTLELSAEQERVYLRRAKEEILMPGVEETIGEEVVRRVAEGMERCPGWKGD